MTGHKWPWATLEEVAAITAGNPAPQGHEFFGDGTRPFVRVQDLGRLDGKARLTITADRVNDRAAASLKLFPRGSVLFTKSGASLLLNQRAILGRDMHVVSHIGVAVPGPRVTSEWLYYWLRTVDFVDISHGANMPSLPLSRLKQLRIPVPSLGEQHARVAEIEKQFSRVDEAVVNLKRIRAQIKRYKAAILQAAIDGRLIPTEAELARKEARSYETAPQMLRRVLGVRQSERHEKAKHGENPVPDMPDLPNLPEGWIWTTASALAAPSAESIAAGPFGTIFKAKDFRASGVPIIFLRHVAPGQYLTHKPSYMDRSKWEQIFKPYSVFGGELLVTKLGEPPGVCAIYPDGIGPAMVTPDVIKMIPEKALVVPRFLMHYFNSTTARRFSTGVAFGTTRLRLTLPIFRAMPVPLPPLQEQHRIVEEIDRRMSFISEIEKAVDANNSRAKALREAVLALWLGKNHQGLLR